MEGMDILNELSDVFYKLLKELGLLVLEILLFVFRELDEVSPVHFQHRFLVLFFFVFESVWMVDIKDVVLLEHRTELHSDDGLLLLDLV